MDNQVVKIARSYMKESVSAAQSEKQKEYAALFRTMCEERNVQNPFELDDAGMKAFFAEISSRWEAQ